jgi:hypothetical protein
MNELMKGPNKRGREDFENAIFKIFPLCQPWWRFVGLLGPLIYQAGSLSESQDYMCGIDYINILCMYLTEGSVYLQHNVMLYIQKSISENAGNCSHIGVEK